MNKKGALELSVNAIVTLIIALAVLGLIIGFAVSQFNKVSSKIQITEETPEPTPQNPIMIPNGGSELILSKQSPNGLSVKVYNTGTALTSATTPTITCTGTTGNTFSVSTIVPAIDPGESGEIVFAVDATGATLGRHACSLAIGDMSRTVFITVE